jgi:dephospho-CoA kinase
MRVVGLTGGIGSGKSSVSRLLKAHGALVIDADRIAHQLQARGQPVWRRIVEEFGWWVLQPDGQLDRRKLGYRVFNNSEERQRLNNIVHPAVHQEMFHQLAEAAQQGVRVAVLDVPLLIEGGLYQRVDEVWVVYAEPGQQLERIQARDHLSLEAAQRRVGAQMPLKDKLAYAHYVIDNTRDPEYLEKVVQQLWRKVVQDEESPDDSGSD